MAKKRRKPLSEQLSEAVKSCGLTRYRISKETDIPQSTLSRFMSGQREMSFDVMNRLGEFLQIELTVHGPAKPVRKRSERK